MKDTIWRTDLVRLGHQGENDARKITVYVGEWQEAYPSCTVSLRFIRTAGEAPYVPNGVSVTGNRLEWLVKAEDCAIPGYGQAELRATVGDVVVKSDIVKTFVEACLPGTVSPEPPDAVKSWFDQLEDDVDGVTGVAAQAAEDAADALEAAGAAQTAVESKQDAPSTGGTAGQVLGLNSSLEPVWVDNGVDSVIRYDQDQSLTIAQKTTACANAGAASERIFDAVTGNVPFGGADGSATNRNCTITRVGQRYTVSRAAAHSSNSDFALMPTMQAANANSAGANFDTWAAASTFKLTAGKKYRLEARIISGAFPTNATFNFTPMNEAGTTLSADATRMANGVYYQDFVFSGTYFTIVGYASGAFFTGDTPLVFDLSLREIDDDTYLGGVNREKVDGVNWLVDIGSAPVTRSIERNGLTCTVNGNKIVLNGTNGNASAMRYRLCSTITTKAGGTTKDQNLVSGVWLKAGHRYRICGRRISGTYTQATASPWWICIYPVGSGAAIYDSSYTDGEVSLLYGTVDTDTEFCTWVICQTGDSFSNAVIEAWVDDLTMNPDADCPIPTTGTDPVITARQNKRYTCGTLSTLDFTPCAFGSCEVIFTSGASQTVLTVPNTVKWPDWFDPTSLEANRVYDIIVTDGVYGAVTSWAT